MLRFRLMKPTDIQPGTGAVVVRIRLAEKREWVEMAGVPEILVPSDVIGGEPHWMPVPFMLLNPESGPVIKVVGGNGKLPA